MIDFSTIEGMYFVGIGGIGMSALALYFRKGGYDIAGYDRTSGMITDNLASYGCTISFVDEINSLPALYRSSDNKGKVLVVYTPAIPAENKILSYFRERGYPVYKRSEILGAISRETDTIAIAGTHGKTTISAMTAHLLKQSHVDCSAFLGGISKNYNSNLILGESRYTVMEADEYDRSFHRLSPVMAVVSAMDPDHLEIYGDHKTMIAAYNVFCGKIRHGGMLIYNSKLKGKIIHPEGVTCLTYGKDAGSDYRYLNVEHQEDYYSFDLETPAGILNDLHFPFPGIINIENLTAAIAVALNCGVNESEIRKAIILFRGVRRRFDIRINLPGLTYVDDYAHHPEEIRAFITSVREYFGKRKIRAIFQPHLYTRTRDHADGFAAILDTLDEVILLPVYPAREKPIEGVSSGMIFKKMKLANKIMMEMSDIPGKLNVKDLDVLVTIGAGDIDRLVEPIEKKLKELRGR
ncbi:MAG: UDP-N-acetylmuramate--L-alanine ligase [Bacteroidales bacterium]